MWTLVGVIALSGCDVAVSACVMWYLVNVIVLSGCDVAVSACVMWYLVDVVCCGVWMLFVRLTYLSLLLFNLCRGGGVWG